MSNMSGVVEAVRKDGKAIQVGGNWYSSFNPVKGVNKGDSVVFEYVEKGNFKNIKGNVRVDGASAAPAASGASRTTLGGGYAKGTFPIDARDGQRSIIRQNAMTNARELVVALNPKAKAEELVPLIITVARKFEAYATGDLDLEIAQQYLDGTLDKDDAGLDVA